MKIRVGARNQAHAFDGVPGEKVLHAGLRSGIALPYECGTGTCGTCKARLVEGDLVHEWPEAPGHAGLRREAGEFLMCQSVARGDCVLEVARAVEPMAPDAHRPGRVDAVIRSRAMLTHDVAALEVAPARPVDFDAGQFMLLTAPGITGARAYSMVNFARAAERLDFVVKKKAGGSMSEWLFGDAAPVAGALVGLFGPLGAATFRPDAGKNLLCVAGGSGVAGMMSILARAAGDGYFARHAGDLVFGVRGARDVFLLDELAAIEAASGDGLAVTVALSDEAVDPALPARYPRFAFAQGFAHAVAAQRMKGRFDNVRAYVAGPPPMVDATLRMLLLEGKLRRDSIRYDKFS